MPWPERLLALRAVWPVVAFDDGLATAGNAAIDQLKARAASIEGQLGSALHTCDAGLDIDTARLSFTEQPLCGLLVLPRIRLDSTAFTAFRNAAGARYIANPEPAAWIASKIKLGRVGEVTDIMGDVAFLASDAAALISGTSLIVDGGWTAD